MNLADRIKATQEQIVNDKDALLALTKSLEDTPDDDSILAQVDSLTATVEKSIKTLESLQKAEAAIAERAKSAPAVIHPTGNAKDAEDLWVKEAVVKFIAHARRQAPDQVRQEVYGTNKALEAVFQTKAAVPVATTFTAGWAQELVQQDTRGFINLLTPLSVVAALSGRMMNLDFGGFDSVKIPRRAARAAGTNSLAGVWVGEAGAIPLGRLSVDSATLTRSKLGIISTFTQELAERSTPAIEGVIRQAMLEDTSIALDSAFLSNAAAIAGIRPAGILAGVTVGSGAAGGGVDAVIQDIKTMVSALTAGGLGQRPVLVINSTDALSVGLMQTALGEMLFQSDLNAGRLLGVEVVKSLNVPKGTAILLDAPYIALAMDAPAFAVSDVASVFEADAGAAAPTHSSAGGVITTGANVGVVPQNGGLAIAGGTGAAYAGGLGRSLFQTQSIGVRMTQYVGWAPVVPNGTGGPVAALNTLTW